MNIPSRTALFSSVFVLVAFVAALVFNGAHLQYYSLAMLALFGWLLLALLTGYHRHHTPIVTPLTLAVLLFVGFLLISLLYHPVPYLGMMNVWWIGVFGLIILIYLLLPESETSWRWGFGLLMFAVVALALWGAVEKLVYGLDPEASFYNKNSLAALISLALFPLATLYLSLATPTRRYLIASVLLLFAFMLGVITSRGALMGFAVASVVLFALIWQHVSHRRLAVLGGWLLGGFGLATIYTQLIAGGHDVVSRMATLAEPSQAGNTRYMLWGPAWQMLQEQPWSGIGLGAFFLKLPASANLQDNSAGYYVHNDYLQIATETGLPGLFFLLLVVGVLIWQFSRLVRHYRQRLTSTHSKGSPVELTTYLQVSGLFAALLAFGIHSAFTYNFYILPLMIVVGLYLARLDRLYANQVGAGCWRFSWKPHFHPLSFYLLSFAIVVTASGYFVTLAVADHYHQRAVKLAASGQIQQAHFAFERAQRLSPYMDSHFYTDADLLIHSAELLPEDSTKRSDLLDYAAGKLEKAARLNPYQASTPYLQGKLLHLRNHEASEAVRYYRQALERNPRYLPARLALARHYRQLERPDEAFAILKAGLHYPYHRLSRDLLEYVDLTAQLATQTGRAELGERLQSRFEQFQQAYELQQQHGLKRPSQRY